jgi:hypothetical protein
MDDDFLQFDPAGDFGGEGMADRGMGYSDDKLEHFYDRLDGIYTTWHSLEEEKYRCMQHGRFAFERQVVEMNETPDLQYYKISVSRNGGPTAMMLKDNTLFLGGRKDDMRRLQNVLFFFSSYGKLLKTVHLANLIDGLDPNQRWVAFDFTDEEDFFLVSDVGQIYFIDPWTGSFKEGKPQGKHLHVVFAKNRIVDTRFDQKSNTLVLRNMACQFHFVKNVAEVSADAHGMPAQDFRSCSVLEEMADENDDQLISDYVLIPPKESGTRQYELLVADPYEGFHILTVKKPDEHFGAGEPTHHKDFRGLCGDDPGADEPIGKIEHFALSANGKLIAIYAN